MGHRDEYELIEHSHLADCSMFLVEMRYRPLHLHKELEFILVLEGSGKVSVENTVFGITRGDILLFDSGAAHELTSVEDGLLLLAIQVSRSFCKRFCPQLRNTRFHTTLLTPLYTQGELEGLRHTLLAAYRAYLEHSMAGSFACMSHINAIFSSLLDRVPYQVLDQAQIETKRMYEKRLQRILMYLDEHFREPIRLKDLANIAEITTTHLSHFFKEQLNITLQEYLTRLRVEAAMQLLKNTDIAPTSIAYECGFSDPKYMNQGFQRLLGMRPAQWRLESQSYGSAKFSTTEHTMQYILSEEEAKQCLSSLR